MADRHSPTIGILLCAGRNDNVVRYSLAGSTAPLAVADYSYDALPPAARAAVPTDIELDDAAGIALGSARSQRRAGRGANGGSEVSVGAEVANVVR